MPGVESGSGGGLPMNMVRPIRSNSVGGLGGLVRQHGVASPHMLGGSGPAGRCSPAIMMDGGLDGGGGGGGSSMMPSMARSTRARSFDGRTAIMMDSNLDVGGAGGSGPSMLPSMARATRARSFDGRSRSAFGGSLSSSPSMVGMSGDSVGGIGMSASLSPPSGESRHYGGGGGGGGSHTPHMMSRSSPHDGSQVMMHRARRSSYDERMMMSAGQAAVSRRTSASPPLPHHVWRGDGGGHGDSVPANHHHNHQHHQQQQPQPRRPTSLSLASGDGFERLRSLSTSAAPLQGQKPASLGSGSSAVGYERMSIPPLQTLSASMNSSGGVGDGAGPGRSGPSTTMDAISMECAEFALLTPKSSSIAARQQSAIGSAPSIKAWSPQSGGKGRYFSSMNTYYSGVCIFRVVRFFARSAFLLLSLVSAKIVPFGLMHVAVPIGL